MEVKDIVRLERAIKFQLNKHFGWGAVRWYNYLNEQEKEYIRALLKEWSEEDKG